MTLLTRCLLGLALASSACGSAPTCEDYAGKRLVTPSTSGTATLSAAGESSTRRLRVTLRGLPELWDSASPLREALLTTSVLERYAEGEPGGDGLTQMPRILTSFGTEPPVDSSARPYYPGSAPTLLGNALFDCSRDPEGPCCKYGATECEVVRTLFVTRTEGQPFPPVTVSWETSASVVVGQCPIGSSPELELTPEDEP